MELNGTVTLKKVTPTDAIYGVKIPGAGFMTLYVPIKPGDPIGKSGTVAVDIAVPEDAPAPKAAKGKK